MSSTSTSVPCLGANKASNLMKELDILDHPVLINVSGLNNSPSLDALNAILGVDSLNQLDDRVKVLLNDLRIQQAQISQKKIQMEQYGNFFMKDAIKGYQETSSKLDTLSKQLSDSIEQIELKEMSLSKPIQSLQELVTQSTRIQHARCYTRLVLKIAQQSEMIENNVRKLVQFKPYSKILQGTHDKDTMLDNFTEFQDEDHICQSTIHSCNKKDSPYFKLDKVFLDTWNALIGLAASSLIDPFFELIEYHAFFKPLECSHLKKYIANKISRLSRILKPEVENIYLATLEAINWPNALYKVEANNRKENYIAIEDTPSFSQLLFTKNTKTIQPEKLECFQKAFSLLTQFQCALNNVSKDIEFGISMGSSINTAFNSAESSSNTTVHDQIEIIQGKTSSLLPLWAINGLLRPLILRFNFNFRGHQKTNRLDKPHWCYSYIRSIIDNHESLMNLLTHQLHEMGLGIYNVRTEILRGLMVEIKKKLFADIEMVIKLADHVDLDNPHVKQINSDRVKLDDNSRACDNNTGAHLPFSVNSKFQKLVKRSAIQIGSSLGKFSINANYQTSSKIPFSKDSPHDSMGPSSIRTIFNQNAKDIKLGADSEPLISHIIDETLNFEAILGQWDYPCVSTDVSTFPHPIEVFFLDAYGWIWLKMELGLLNEQWHEALAQPDAWDRQFSGIPVEEDLTRVPLHTTIIFNSLALLTTRYSLLKDNQKPLMNEFLQGQIDLLLEYRKKLHVLVEEDLPDLPFQTMLQRASEIYNAVDYSCKTLQHWIYGNGEKQLLFMEMQMWRLDVPSVECVEGSVWAQPLYELKLLRKSILKLMVETTMKAIKTVMKDCRNIGCHLDHSLNKAMSFSSSLVNNNGGILDSGELRDVDFDIIQGSAHIDDALYLLNESSDQVFNTINVNTFQKYWKVLTFSLGRYLLADFITERDFTTLAPTFIVQFQINVQLIRKTIDSWENIHPSCSTAGGSLTDYVFLPILEAIQLIKTIDSSEKRKDMQNALKQLKSQEQESSKIKKLPIKYLAIAETLRGLKKRFFVS